MRLVGQHEEKRSNMPNASKIQQLIQRLEETLAVQLRSGYYGSGELVWNIKDGHLLDVDVTIRRKIKLNR